jgi:hypothetical protein
VSNRLSQRLTVLSLLSASTPIFVSPSSPGIAHFCIDLSFHYSGTIGSFLHLHALMLPSCRNPLLVLRVVTMLYKEAPSAKVVHFLFIRLVQVRGTVRLTLLAVVRVAVVVAVAELPASIGGTAGEMVRARALVRTLLSAAAALEVSARTPSRFHVWHRRLALAA